MNIICFDSLVVAFVGGGTNLASVDSAIHVPTYYSEIFKVGMTERMSSNFCLLTVNKNKLKVDEAMVRMRCSSKLPTQQNPHRAFI